MNTFIAELLRKVEQALDNECAPKAVALLQDVETRLVDGAPTHEEIRSLLPTLRARLTNSDHTGTQIFGMEQLIDKLGQMNGAAKVVSYGFISPRAAGNIYLVSEDGPALGAAIVDR